MLNLAGTVSLFAQADVNPRDAEAMREAARHTSSKFLGTDFQVVLGIGLVLAALLFFWAFFLRKRPKQTRGSLVLRGKDEHSSEAYGASGRRRRRKRRPGHPDNWGRNPTLGETGGLPPARPEEPEAPPPGSQAPPAR
jgi:hypothetical protein